MAKGIEKAGKTVGDALKAALDELGVTKDMVEYEVLEEGAKGLFGLRSREARVRVRLKAAGDGAGPDGDDGDGGPGSWDG
ncbi:MAG: Jag N-terminal domain-containing protein, partial [Oscillospiraceae bacterium]|nr:Jag N-terminal domain-containing protein [Oscillospiraceae bacterium]